MNGKVKMGIAVAVTALVSIPIGVAAGGGGSTSSPEAETVERTVVEKVESTPQSCVKALRYADAIRDESTEYIELTVDFPTQIEKAFDAGVTYDTQKLQEVSAWLEDFTAEVDDLTVKVGRDVAQFERFSMDCRSSQ